jgi:hypothetical protein
MSPFPCWGTELLADLQAGRDEVLSVSMSAVSHGWTLAKAWLYRAMKRIRSDDTGPDSTADETPSPKSKTGVELLSDPTPRPP